MAGRQRARRFAVGMERRLDRLRLARKADEPPANLRIVGYMGHGSDLGAIVRGRVMDNPEPPAAIQGEGLGAALRRTIARFNTLELPGVPLYVRIADVETTTETDEDGYFHARLSTSLDGSNRWVEGEVGLSAPYRSVSERSSPVSVMVPGPEARFGVISDIDDTILETATQRPLTMARNTFTGSAMTRVPMTGVPEWYRGLAANGLNPVYYVSSSPWNLYGMLTGFIEHRALPIGPLLLRDFLGTDKSRTHRSHKSALIEEILEMNRGLPFVLVGDSGQEDLEIYAEIRGRHPDQVRAIYIRIVHRRPNRQSRVVIEKSRDADSPFVFAEDTVAMAQHSAEIGLVDSNTVVDVQRALTG